MGTSLGRLYAANFAYRTFATGTVSGLSRTLAPSTSYYLVTVPGGFTGSAEGYQWSYTDSTSGTGFPSLWTLSTDSGATWSTPFLLSPNQMRITAASAVPEIDPAGFGSVAALITGALGLIERRRLKAQAA